MIVDKIPDNDEEIILLLKHNKLPIQEITQFLMAIKDDKIRDEYIASLKNPLKMYLTDNIIRLRGSEEEKAAWNERIIEISDITMLSAEEFEKMPDNTMIRICGEYTGSWQRQLYSKETYIKIVKRIDELFGNIKPATKGDIKSELITFLMVYIKAAKILFDESTMVFPGMNDPELQVSSRSLEGGILNGRCVCEGYAEILRNVLKSKGIETRFIKGTTKDGNTHAWNQVKIGGKWFNVDLTWDIENYKDCIFDYDVLKTDEEFKEHDKYELYRPKGEEKCKMSIGELARSNEIEI